MRKKGKKRNKNIYRGTGSGFKYKKKYGQNFLHDTVKAGRIIEAASPDKNDIFIEIGAGAGRLTARLDKEVKKIYAVEIDPEAVKKLRGLNLENTVIIERDFLDIDTDKIAGGQKVKIIGNIPYYITAPIIEKTITERKNISEMYFTAQKEVAERICAEEGSKRYGSLSVFVQFYADAYYLFKIGKKAFFPEPRVDSAFIKIIFREGKIKTADKTLFFRIVRGAFTGRRKMLATFLKKFLKIPGGDAKKVLSEAGVNISARPEDVSIIDFAKISDLVYNRIQNSKFKDKN